jgi:ABC-type glycerol-3-phosphate transport system permease component
MRRGKGWFIVKFLAPAVLLYGLFVVWPLLQAFRISFYRWHGISAKKTFVGITNYKNLVGDPVFHKAVANNLYLLVIGGLVTLAVSVLIAHALQAQNRMSKALRSFILVPQMLSLVVVAIQPQLRAYYHWDERGRPRQIRPHLAWRKQNRATGGRDLLHLVRGRFLHHAVLGWVEGHPRGGHRSR